MSVVTAFFDIGRSDWAGKIVSGRTIPDWILHSTETYLEWFDRLAGLRNQMVIFTEERFAASVLEMRGARILNR